MKKIMKKILAGLVLVLLVFVMPSSMAIGDIGGMAGGSVPVGGSSGNYNISGGNVTSGPGGPGHGGAIHGVPGGIVNISEKVKHWHQNLGKTLHDFLTSEETREEIKQRVRACIQSQSEECKKLREIGRYIAKGVLERALNHTIEQLEELKQRIELRVNLSDEQKQEIIQKIDELISRLNELKTKIYEAETPEEIREIIREYRGMRHNLNLQLRIKIHAMRQKRIGLVLQRAQQLQVKLERFLEKCNDTQRIEVETKIDEFKSKIDEALSYYEENKEIWTELRNVDWKSMTAEERRQLIREKINEAKEKLREAHLTLRDAQHILKEIIIDLKLCAGQHVGEEKENEEETGVEEEENESEGNITSPVIPGAGSTQSQTA